MHFFGIKCNFFNSKVVFLENKKYVWTLENNKSLYLTSSLCI